MKYISAILFLLLVTQLRAQTNTFPGSGNVGIGTTTPESKLQVKTGPADVNVGNATRVSSDALSIVAQTGGRSSTLGAQIEFVIPADTTGLNPWGQGRIITVAGNGNTRNATGKMILGTRRQMNKLGTGSEWYYGNDLVIDGKGHIGINTLVPKEALSVNGNIRAKEIKVETANWPDYVFEEGYELPSLTETEAFIKQHKHLPGMPNKEQVATEGISLGEMNWKLLEKVEELTLLLIEKEKAEKEQNERIERLEQDNIELRKYYLTEPKKY